MDGRTMREPDDARRLEDLPEHEDDRDVETVGGGIMSQGGTTIDRGTGTVDGTAQGPDAGDEGDESGDPPTPPPAFRPRTG